MNDDYVDSCDRLGSLRHRDHKFITFNKFVKPKLVCLQILELLHLPHLGELTTGGTK